MRTLLSMMMMMMMLLVLSVDVASAQDNNPDEANSGDARQADDDPDNQASDPPRRGALRFANPGVLTISSDAAFSIQRQSTSGVSGGTTSIYLSPAADYFVIRDLSIGGFIGFNYVRAGDGDSMRFAIGPRVGYNFALSDMWSMWPRAGVSLAVTNTNLDPGPSTEETTFALNLFVPLIAHPTPHFFIGLGPFLDTDLSGDARTTVFGLRLTTGGWLDVSGDTQADAS